MICQEILTSSPGFFIPVIQSKILHMKYIQEKNRQLATWVAFAITPLSGIAVDLYSPSLPAMATDLHVSVLQMQVSVSIYLIFYGLCQLFVGVLMDSFGRYKLSLVSLAIFALASFAIVIFPNIHLIYFSRAVQGVSIGIVLVAKRAFFVDVYQGEKLKHTLSLVTIIWSIGPIAAPFIGGYIQTSFGWQYNFLFLGGAAFIGFVLDWIFGGETLKEPSRFHFSNIKYSYANMLRTFDFVMSIVLASLAYSVAMIFTLTSPFLMEHVFHENSIVVGYILLTSGTGWLAGNFLGKMLIKADFTKTVFWANLVQFALVTLLGISFRFAPNLYVMVILTFFIVMMSAFIFNNFFTYSLGRFPKAAGLAGGLVGGLVYTLLSGVTYLLVLFIPVKGLSSLAWYDILLVGSIGIAIVLFVRGKRRKLELKNATC